MQMLFIFEDKETEIVAKKSDLGILQLLFLNK